MSTPRPVSFDKRRTEELLSLLDARLRARGVSASIYLVGGAAIALTVRDSRRTADLDVLVSDPVVLEEADALGVEQGLPPGWLNTSAAPWVPPRPPETSSRDGSPGLAVYVAPKQHLLAMKLVSLRRQDEPDIIALAADLGMSEGTAQDFADLLAEVYVGEGALEQALGVTDPRTEALEIGAWVVTRLQARTN